MSNHTFVICAYGDSQHLEACVQSLLSQTVSSEIILYTSTPSDYIKTIAETYAIPIYTANGGGIGKDWNLALSFVKTPYVTIAHQDDIYLETYAEHILKRLSDQVIIAYSDYAELKDNALIKTSTNLKIKRFMLAMMQVFPASRFWRHRVLAFGNPISCPAVTYNLRKMKDFRFDEKLTVSLDWYAWYQLAKYQGRFEWVPKILMYHRIHEESETTNRIENNSRTEEDLMMYQLFWPNWLAKVLMSFYKKSQQSNF